MGIKRIVDVQFWNDDKVLEYFSPEDKLFMLYLMTNPHTTQLGVYAINKKHMSFELGYTIDVVNVLLDRFENKYEMIKYSNDTKEIAIKNYLKHSIIKGGKPVEDCLTKEIKQVKDKSLLGFVYSNLKDCESLNDTVKKIIESLNEYDNNNDNEYDNENDNDNDNEVSYHDSLHDTCDAVIKRLNELAGTNYRSDGKATQNLIKALLKDYTEEDIIMVVEKMCYKWSNPKKGEKDMSEYLRPSTLFRRSNFENYLGMKVQTKEVTTGDLAECMTFNKFRQV